ncbi:MAG: RusA family crossover junction endodeoxyribonuclease [Phycisphaerae bacterium]|nr:RusA family crossover junction endodeoxyribonuclease [Phycisphaerae bacterium]
MSPSYSFTVLGEPQALKRHRNVRRGKFIGQYDPSATDKKDFAAAVQQYAPPKLITEAVKIAIYAYFGRPKSHFRTGKYANKLKPNAPILHTTKPDFDNVAKFVADALNGIFWKDDSQIYKATVWKLYDHEKPRVEIFVNVV